jgi:threonine dehydratase
MFDIKAKVLAAESRIRSHIRETPLEHSISFSKINGCQVYLKCENLQHTGAFKVRGAINKLLTLTPEQRSQGIVTASSGNHGAAVAFGLNKLNMRGIVFVRKRQINHPLPRKSILLHTSYQ